MPEVTPIVFVVDDDVSVRESLELLISTAGWQPETFASASEFLSRPRATVPCCLVLDVTLPGLNGLELQQRIAEDRGVRLGEALVEDDVGGAGHGGRVGNLVAGRADRNRAGMEWRVDGSDDNGRNRRRR